MNRSELVDSVSAAAGLDKHQAESAVKAVVDAVMSESQAGGKVSIFGFGTFTPTSRQARVGRNPQTGAAVNIAASNSVRFSPSTAFKELLNAKRGARKAGAKAAGSQAGSKTSSAKKTATTKRSAATAKQATPAKKTAQASTPAAKKASTKAIKASKK